MENLDDKAFDFHKPLIVGAVVIAVAFGGFGIWASIAPIQGAAVAPGIVMVAGNRKTIQHFEGGIVKQLYVREGDRVEAGQVLLELDDTQTRAQLDISIAQYLIAQATEARLLAERDGSETILFPEALYSKDPRALEAMDAQQRVFDARKAALLGEEELLFQRVEQLTSQVDGYTAIINGKKNLISSYESEISDYKKLIKKGFSDKVKLRELERLHATLISEIAELEADVITTSLQIGETRLKQLQIHKDFRSRVVDQLGETKSNIFNLDDRIRALKDRVARTKIVTPVKGVVFDLAAHTIGGVIQPGDAIMEIVPLADDLVIEAKISPGDIDRVYEGQLTDIRFTAFNQRRTPVIEGRLMRVSPDAMIEQGQNYFAAKVEVTERGFAMLEELELQPGMPADVFINTGGRTVLEYVLRPITDGLAKSMTDD